MTHASKKRLPLEAVACCAGGVARRGYEEREVPLMEGGLRYTIHPVTGQLLTSQVQFESQDRGTAAQKPHREDRSIIKVCHYFNQPAF